MNKIILMFVLLFSVRGISDAGIPMGSYIETKGTQAKEIYEKLKTSPLVLVDKDTPSPGKESIHRAKEATHSPVSLGCVWHQVKDTASGVIDSEEYTCTSEMSIR